MTDSPTPTMNLFSNISHFLDQNYLYYTAVDTDMTNRFIFNQNISYHPENRPE